MCHNLSYESETVLGFNLSYDSHFQRVSFDTSVIFILLHLQSFNSMSTMYDQSIKIVVQHPASRTRVEDWRSDEELFNNEEELKENKSM